MNDKYLHKSIEEIAVEEKFIDWVKNEKHNDAMNTFLDTYPDQIDKINQAIYLVNAVHFTKMAPIPQNKINRLWDRIENSIVETEAEKEVEAKKSAPVPVVRKIYSKPWLAAAAIIGIITLAFFFSQNNDTEIQVAFAQKIEKMLPDNSKMWINAGSSVVFDDKFQGEDRKVKLLGEAQFQVIKGIGQFIVETNHAKVIVLGTKFNVRERKNSFILECFEGKVQVNIDGISEIIKGGSAFKYNFKEKKSSIYNVTPDGSADWILGEIKFQAEPLENVIRELERQFDTKIEFNKDISNALYSGFFKTDNLEKALQSVFWPMKKTFKISDKKIIID